MINDGVEKSITQAKENQKHPISMSSGITVKEEHH
jgi:hypothetical protein